MRFHHPNDSACPVCGAVIDGEFVPVHDKWHKDFDYFVQAARSADAAKRRSP
jgi:hypothetical protein